ncbi:ABC transporter substrate-binding protein [Micromonospora globispora]|uniref:ABC transporter substrate-binding protein n=1 Tax=Micromonospora globispora TaxID=1450148 RepID=A0A317JVS4_9ACTN|nr:ABC transporter substrate-binding protein [Micromonospora globispora]PWU44765.1 ABC transporter substrate-binding protein [Micromonospora globispora]PWU61234.1 ABC transporter substrate-binding protein [Micromonospora globispora]RQW96269.1 ABC transporter substrate-binding protein [Micromonospora globispora]
MQARRLKAALALAASAALAVGAAGCAKSERDGGDSGEAKTGGTFVFAGAGDPKNFDPIFNDDGESFRPVRQMFDTLITHKPGTAELEGGLAESWDHDAEGKVWTFKLRQGVKFHDGTPFNAAAVCYNFDRWYNMKGAAAQSQMIYYMDVFGGFAKNDSPDAGKSIYNKCEAKDDGTAVLTLNQYKGAFPGAFALTSLSIASPDALKKYDADTVKQNGDSFEYSAFANEHPVGTGPFIFGGWDKAKGEITLNRNPDYWGDKAKVDKLIIKIIKDENTRKQELRAGTVQGIDFPAPADRKALEGEGFNVINRPAFNILYLGINQKNPKLKDLRVRQAIAYALNRQQLVQTKGPGGTKVADQFMPDTVLGYAPDVQKYDYNPEKAKQLLKEAGAENLTLNFYYPTDVSRPYMPNPQEIFTVLANDLGAVGIKVNGVARPWNGGYKDDVQQFGKQDLHILGWTGDYNDPGNFVGTFFGRAKTEFGDAAMTEMFDAIAKADGTVDEAGKKAAWEQVNRDIAAKWLPAVPIWHAPPAIVVTKNVKGLVASPLTDERFNTVSVS